MLAQNFKTAVDLGIGDVELRILTQLLGRLEREEIPANLFDMAHVYNETECGTAGCLLGWCRMMSGNDAMMLATERPPELSNLFFPDHRPMAYEATREQAATALRSYLTTGYPCWEDIFELTE